MTKFVLLTDYIYTLPNNEKNALAENCKDYICDHVKSYSHFNFEINIRQETAHMPEEIQKFKSLSVEQLYKVIGDMKKFINQTSHIQNNNDYFYLGERVSATFLRFMYAMDIEFAERQLVNWEIVKMARMTHRQLVKYVKSNELPEDWSHSYELPVCLTGKGNNMEYGFAP